MKPTYASERGIQPGELDDEQDRVWSAWRDTTDPASPAHIAGWRDHDLNIATRRRILLELDHYAERGPRNEAAS